MYCSVVNYHNILDPKKVEEIAINFEGASSRWILSSLKDDVRDLNLKVSGFLFFFILFVSLVAHLIN